MHNLCIFPMIDFYYLRMRREKDQRVGFPLALKLMLSNILINLQKYSQRRAGNQLRLLIR